MAALSMLLAIPRIRHASAREQAHMSTLLSPFVNIPTPFIAVTPRSICFMISCDTLSPCVVIIRLIQGNFVLPEEKLNKIAYQKRSFPIWRGLFLSQTGWGLT